MAFWPCSVSERGVTAKIPTTAVTIPTIITSSGNTIPRTDPCEVPANAADPRMIAATRVT